uniref:Uncharacterized protein n=1 Tax=Catharus ustulatus TaxID=91951 RepID=A0A8C3TW95_CATUS
MSPPPLQLRALSVTDEKAALDQGDVLFTGQEFFVGISPWTNPRGAEAVAEAFRDFRVSTVPVGGGGHLTGFLSMADPQTIAHGCSHSTQRALRVGRGLAGEEIPIWGGGSQNLGRGQPSKNPPETPKVPLRLPKGPQKLSETPSRP